MTLDMSKMTWTCMCCGDERPDAVIGVARLLAQMPDAFPDTRVNVRFCRDRAECVAHAHAPGPWAGPIR